MIRENSFSELVESIQEHSYTFPEDGIDGGTYQHSFIIKEMPDPNFYLIGGKRIYDLVEDALKSLYPALDEEDRKMFCDVIPGYLEKPCIILEYIENKQQRDYFFRHIVSADERQLLETSIVRITNIRHLHSIMRTIFLNEFPGFTNAIARLYSNQLKQSSDDARIHNSKNIRKIVYDFCIKLIKKAPH